MGVVRKEFETGRVGYNTSVVSNKNLPAILSMIFKEKCIGNAISFRSQYKGWGPQFWSLEYIINISSNYIPYHLSSQVKSQTYRILSVWLFGNFSSQPEVLLRTELNNTALLHSPHAVKKRLKEGFLWGFRMKRRRQVGKVFRFSFVVSSLSLRTSIENEFLFVWHTVFF